MPPQSRRFRWREVATIAAAAALPVVLAALATHVNPFAASSFVRWDSHLYIDIVNKGYVFESCANVPGYAPEDWCGNAGWFPALPLSMGAVSRLTGAAPRLSGFLIANLAFLLNAFVLLPGVLRAEGADDRTVVVGSVLFALFPGSIYYHAVFPVSLVLSFCLLYVLLLQRGRPLSACAAGVAAGFTYPTGFLIGTAGLAWLLHDLRRARGASPKVLRLAMACLSPLLGFVLAIAAIDAASGARAAFFRVQEKYGHGLHDPLSLLKLIVTHATTSAPMGQSFIVLMLIGGSWALYLFRVRQGRVRPIDTVSLATGTALWLFPLILGSGVSLYRAESLVALILPLGREGFGSRLIVGATVVLLASLSVTMSVLFFRGRLI